jgi:hypothetical protein
MHENSYAGPLGDEKVKKALPTLAHLLAHGIAAENVEVVAMSPLPSSKREPPPIRGGPCCRPPCCALIVAQSDMKVCRHFALEASAIYSTS